MTGATIVRRETRPVLPRAARGPVLGAVVLALAGFVAMTAWLHDSRYSTGFDTSVRSWVFAHSGTVAKHVLLGLSEPGVTITVATLVVLGAAAVRQWNVAVAAAVGPLLAVGLMRYVLKPAIDREFGLVAQLSHGFVKPGPAFPSGHQTGLTSTVLVLSIVVLRSGLSRRVKLGWCAVAVLWTLGGAIGLVRNDYHYATDTVGGLLLAVVVVLGTALVVDLVWPRVVSSPVGQRLTRTTRAA